MCGYKTPLVVDQREMSRFIWSRAGCVEHEAHSSRRGPQGGRGSSHRPSSGDAGQVLSHRRSTCAASACFGDALLTRCLSVFATGLRLRRRRPVSRCLVVARLRRRRSARRAPPPVPRTSLETLTSWDALLGSGASTSATRRSTGSTAGAADVARDADVLGRAAW
jgi:hypothetical protein